MCLGRCYQALGKLEAALEHYDSALRADGSKAYAFFCRGHCRRLLGDAAGASSDFAQVLKSDAAFPVPYLRRAEAAMARGDGAAAREMLEALALATSSAAVHFAIAMLAPRGLHWLLWPLHVLRW